MATDYKKIAFQYGDKILLAVFLVVFILSALSSFKPYAPPTEPPYRKPNDKTGQTLEKEKLTLKNLSNPPVPDDIKNYGLFTDHNEIFPGKGYKQCPECGLIMQEDYDVCPFPECQHLFGHRIVDSDADQIPDDWEKKYSDYADWEVADADRDDDGDGFDNLQEYLGESHPGDAMSIPVPISVTAIKEKRVDIRFMGYVRKPDRTYDLQVVWGRGKQVEIINTQKPFHGYRFFDPFAARIVATGKETVAVKIQKIDLKTGKPIGAEKTLILYEYIPEDELSATLQIIRGPQQGKRLDEKYIQDEIEVEGITYKIQDIRKDHVKLVDLDSGKIITLYAKTS